MASLMLSVGDYQMVVSDLRTHVVACQVYGEGSPIKGEGNHLVECRECGPDGEGGSVDNFVAAVMGEQEALTLVAAWLSLDSDLESEKCREMLVNAFGPEIKDWMFP